MLAQSYLTISMMFAIIGGPHPPPPPPLPPPSVVPGIQLLPPTMPMVLGSRAMPLMICSFCQDNRNENDVRACKRLAEADQKVTKASKKVAPGEPNDFERGMAAARKCGGVAREQGECDTWRTAVKQRAKACTLLEAHKTDEPPKPAAGSDGSKVPVIKAGKSEQVAPLGQKLDLVGVVGTLKNVPSVLINGEPVELIETRGSDASAGPVSRGFKISVPTGQAGTNIYVIEACDGADNCFGRDLVVRVLATKDQN